MERDFCIDLDREELDALVALCERTVAGGRPYSLIEAVVVSRLKALTLDVPDRLDWWMDAKHEG